MHYFKDPFLVIDQGIFVKQGVLEDLGCKGLEFRAERVYLEESGSLHCPTRAAQYTRQAPKRARASSTGGRLKKQVIWGRRRVAVANLASCSRERSSAN